MNTSIIRNALLSLAILGSTSVSAVTYSFQQLNDNNNANVGVGGSNQLLVDITDISGDVNFTFTNNVGTSSSITAVYFDDLEEDGLFDDISNDVLGASGENGDVSFSDDATPGNLPQGNSIGFSADFSGDSASPPIPNGVNDAGEFVRFLGELDDDTSFNAVIAAITSGDFNIGLSVQSNQGRGADRYVLSVPGDGGPSEVPLPAAAWLFGSALLGFAGFKRKNA